MDILSKEAAAILATISTPPRPKRKGKRKTFMYFEAKKKEHTNKSGQTQTTVKGANRH